MSYSQNPSAYPLKDLYEKKLDEALKDLTNGDIRQFMKLMINERSFNLNQYKQLTEFLIKQKNFIEIGLGLKFMLVEELIDRFRSYSF